MTGSLRGIRQHEITHGTRARASRPGKSSAYRAADSCSRSEMRRLEREHLIMVCQQGLDLRQRRTAARRNDEFARFVFDDAGIRARIEYLTIQRATIKILAATTTDA